MDNLLAILIPFELSAPLKSVLVVWVALGLEKVLGLSSQIHPLQFFRFVCLQMVKKVSNNHYSEQQLRISGSLALIVLVLPIIIIAYLAHQFAGYQWLFETLLLYILIDYSQDQSYIKKASQAIASNKKQLAKDLLQQKLLRNTQNLSALGLTKASIESIFLRYHHQQFTSIALFLVLGPITALGYRLCYEAHQAWNVKRHEYKVFGGFANVITRLFQLLPSLIMSVSFVLTSAPFQLRYFFLHSGLWQMFKQAVLQQHFHDVLMLCLSYSAQVSSGGPVMYADIKYQRRRFTPVYPHENESLEPTQAHVNTLISLVNRHLIVSLLIVTWIVYCFFPH